MKKIKLITVLVSSVLLFTACTNNPIPDDTQRNIDQQLETLKDEKDKLQKQIEELTRNIGTSDAQNTSALLTAIEAVNIIKTGDMNDIEDYAHPQQGIRFSAYSYVDTQNDVVIDASNFNGLMQSAQTYTFGSYDGTGDPINMTFADYYQEFIYDEDFANAELIGNNTVVKTGNTLNNLADVYPGAYFVEFHFPQFDPQYEGMDWKSLRIVMEQDDGIWYVIGIIHDQWTI